MRERVSYSEVKASMSILASGGSDGLLDLAQSDWEILTQEGRWLAEQRASARKGLHAMIYGSLDAAGLTVFEVPSEYVSAAIVMFVKPANYLTACSEMAMDGRHSVSDLTSRRAEGFEEIHPKVLFALVLEAFGDSDKYRKQFIKRTNKALEID